MMEMEKNYLKEEGEKDLENQSMENSKTRFIIEKKNLSKNFKSICLLLNLSLHNLANCLDCNEKDLVKIMKKETMTNMQYISIRCIFERMLKTVNPNTQSAYYTLLNGNNQEDWINDYIEYCKADLYRQINLDLH